MSFFARLRRRWFGSVGDLASSSDRSKAMIWQPTHLRDISGFVVPPDLRVFVPSELLPHRWANEFVQGPVRIFNPGLTRDRDGWIFAYRVVGPDMIRRIGVCRLDEQLKVVGGSPAPLSDQIEFDGGSDVSDRVRTWFADPRLIWLQGRLFCYWNSGWHEPQNEQFLVELNTSSLRPAGRARKLVLEGERRPLEKNWSFFQTGSDCFASYAVAPHRVLSFSLEGSGNILFSDAYCSEWDASKFQDKFGELRGGAPPYLDRGHYHSFVHCLRGQAPGILYSASVFRFGMHPPFTPTGVPARLLELPNPFGAKRVSENLNPAVEQVEYPCGAILKDNNWFLSFGVNDEHAAIAVIPPARMEWVMSRQSEGSVSK